MSQKGAIDRLLAKDQVVVLCAVTAVTLVATLYTIFGVGMQMSAIEMTRMARAIGTPMEMGAAANWSALQVLLMFLMWWIMMIAMMTPSATPMLLLFSAVKRNSGTKSQATAQVWMFLAGYLTSWAAFSALAVLLQWMLQQAAVLAPGMMTIKGSVLSGGFLLLAGVYQLTPLKAACLKQCQSPAEFLTRHRRPGYRGALVMGSHHGLFCLGCCWALMLLLFVGGIMNLWWIAGLAVFVALEKVSASRSRVSVVFGIALCIAGIWIATNGLWNV
jgi:predicted metal-binding membrane protein